MQPDPESRQLLTAGIEDLLIRQGANKGMLIACFAELARTWELEPLFYKPDESLIYRIQEYNEWCLNPVGEDSGKLMEEIAFLAFGCLQGTNSRESYQSFGPQIDLVISGSSPLWSQLIEYLHLAPTHRTIVVEAKNLGAVGSHGRVTDAQFSRLCSILQTHLDGISQLGVFVTRFGATGFPQTNGSGRKASRLRALQDAQATQIIFHAKTGKYIVVLDHYDIQKLIEPGALPRILEAKIRAVEEWTGMPVQFEGNWQQVDLPPHLAKYVDANDKVSHRS